MNTNGLRTELLLHVLRVAESMGATGYVIRRVRCAHCGKHYTERLGDVASHEGELIRVLCELGTCSCGDVLEVLAVEMVIRGRTNEAHIRVLSTSNTRSGWLEDLQEVDVQLHKLTQDPAYGVRYIPHQENSRTHVMPGNRRIVRADRQLATA